MEFSKYKNKNRSPGSQQEVPSLQVLSNGDTTVRGYQNFSFKNGVLNYDGKKQKFATVEKILEKYSHLSPKSFYDIGCSSGLVCLIADKLGYINITGLDHDEEYVDLAGKMMVNMGKSIVVKTYCFGDSLKSADFVFVGALIHWIFSATSNNGEFKPIVEYLHSITNNMMFIEWVDKEDSCIKGFRHTSMNRNIIKEEYDVKNFEREVNKLFVIEEIVHLENRTRSLYVLRKK